MMNGIDIASYQAGIRISAMGTTDFVIVKATQGVSYDNPYFTKHITEAERSGKLIGVYHYAGGNSPSAEADFFWSRFKPYVGKAVPALDWEGAQNNKFKMGPAWVKPFVERFHALSGVWPLVYMSKDVCRSHDWSWVAARCGLWCAQYGSDRLTDYQNRPWTDKKGLGAWPHMTIFQYSSHGRVMGYGANVDINLAYLDKESWLKIAAGERKEEAPVDMADLFPGVDDDHDYIIKAYQSVLKGRGYYDGAIDGVWGPKSQAAAKAFQGTFGMDQSGIMGLETVKRLFGLVEE